MTADSSHLMQYFEYRKLHPFLRSLVCVSTIIVSGTVEIEAHRATLLGCKGNKGDEIKLQI